MALLLNCLHRVNGIQFQTFPVIKQKKKKNVVCPGLLKLVECLCTSRHGSFVAWGTSPWYTGAALLLFPTESLSVQALRRSTMFCVL